jgi:hypothetical protein
MEPFEEFSDVLRFSAEQLACIFPLCSRPHNHIARFVTTTAGENRF